MKYPEAIIPVRCTQAGVAFGEARLTLLTVGAHLELQWWTGILTHLAFPIAIVQPESELVLYNPSGESVAVFIFDILTGGPHDGGEGPEAHRLFVLGMGNPPFLTPTPKTHQSHT